MSETGQIIYWFW